MLDLYVGGVMPNFKIAPFLQTGSSPNKPWKVGSSEWVKVCNSSRIYLGGGGGGGGRRSPAIRNAVRLGLIGVCRLLPKYAEDRPYKGVGRPLVADPRQKCAATQRRGKNRKKERWGLIRQEKRRLTWKGAKAAQGLCRPIQADKILANATLHGYSRSVAIECYNNV